MTLLARVTLIIQWRYAFSSMSLDSKGESVAHKPVTDHYGREVRSLRLSVTQRCDLACSHCHREGQRPSSKEMSPREIEQMVRIAASMGVRKVKLTGGEPLLREDIVDIVSRTSPLVAEVSLTTNGSHLAEMAESLKEAGLRRVNVSLHTLDPNLYSELCGVDLSAKVVRGIAASVDAGLNPVKVNMVVLKGENDGEIQSMMDFCGSVGAVLQLIEYEADRENASGRHFSQRYFSLKSTEEMLAKQSAETSVNELHRRKRYRVRANGGFVTVEVVRPMHNTEFCSNCTRIRMSSDGKLKPCLLDRNGEVDLLTPLRDGAADEHLKELFLKAVANRRPYWR
jgi:cyclic pyranopterin phosphate synthase